MRLECRSRIIAMTTCVVGMFSANAFAYPEYPILRTVENGGDSLTIRTIGDEHYRYTQTEDGVLVVADSNGVYYYADETGAASKFKAKNAGKRSAEAKKFLNGLDKHKVHRKHHEKHPDRFKRPAGERAKRAAWVPTASSAAVESSSTASSENVPLVLRLPKANGHANGTNRFPVLLIEDNNTRNLDSSKVSGLLNQENYTQDNYTGSVRDYFVDQSSDRFVPIYDLYFVKVNDSFSNYIGNEYSLVKKGIEALLSKYPNFDAPLYDSDNDGNVDALCVLFAGGEVKSGDKHLGGFQYELRYNGNGWSDGRVNAGNNKKFNSYFIIQQKDYLFPTFVHEFSHTMGLKDHYCVYGNDCYTDFRNTQYQAPGAHAWDVMATGMYNNSGITPPNYSAFERNFMGWLNYDSLDMSNDVVAIPPLGTSNFAFRISFSKDEWYILENRQLNKWDSKLPNHGMLIWHIDYNNEVWQNDAMNDDKTHQRIDVVEAGDKRVVSYDDGFMNSWGGGSNLKDDVFPGSQKVTEYGPFVSWGGTTKEIHLYSITEKNDNVCFATKSGVTVSDCEFVRSSSSAAVIESSSSSESKLSSSVQAVSSEAALSSSSVRPRSSSGGWRRSSSSQGWMRSSSSAVVPSSSTEALLAGKVQRGVRMEVSGRMLTVTAETAAPRMLRVFDVQGNMLVSESFDGMEKTLDLGVGRGMFVVQLIGNGMLEGVLRVSVK